MQSRISLLLSLLAASGAALAHPGHGALEIHWHFDDMAWVAVGALALAGIVLLVRKALKR
jgi:hypothetical protein